MSDNITIYILLCLLVLMAVKEYRNIKRSMQLDKECRILLLSIKNRPKYLLRFYLFGIHSAIKRKDYPAFKLFMDRVSYLRDRKGEEV